jgi:seryl-tRNA synthetase
LNRIQNNCSKAFGEKKKAKDPEGNDDPIPQELLDKVTDLTVDDIKKLSFPQIRALKIKIEDLAKEADAPRAELEKSRLEVLAQIGNLVEENVPVSDNEDNTGRVKIVGDCKTTKKYSHVDLVVMVDGVELEAGVGVAGNRGYFLKGSLVLIRGSFDSICPPFNVCSKLHPLVHPIFHEEGGYARSCSIEPI